MNNNYEVDSCDKLSHQQDEFQPPTELELAIREIVKAEDRLEHVTETVTFVEAVGGKVRIPRTMASIATDQPGISLAGLGDHEFKTFIEGPLLALFETITKGERKPCRPIRTTSRLGQLLEPSYELSRLGQRIIACCQLYQSVWSIAYVNHVFHPTVTVMLRAMRTYADVIKRHGEPGVQVTQQRALVVALQRLLRFVRRVAKDWRFINALRAHERQEQDNFSSARDFLYHQAGAHSKLLILRIDLYFKPYYDVQRADKAVHDFLRWLRGKACKRTLLPGYLGFMIKRENGLIRGMHWHLMVVCNGNEQRSADFLTRQLGEHWMRRTGQGPGAFHNCYPDRKRYLFNGLGLVTLDDVEKLAGIRAAIWYMSKQDCVIKATSNKERNFWRSPIPRQARQKLGRPRASSDPLKLVQRMLGGKRSKYPPGFAPVHPVHRQPRLSGQVASVSEPACWTEGGGE
ncbi:MAG: hypothetical protein J0M21_00630 [Xanthomonadales bacterium]|nr:hypothetical protein [Xanthomonadales bacterium]